jgi:hypothetical protein
MTLKSLDNDEFRSLDPADQEILFMHVVGGEDWDSLNPQDQQILKNKYLSAPQPIAPQPAAPQPVAPAPQPAAPRTDLPEIPADVYNRLATPEPSVSVMGQSGQAFGVGGGWQSADNVVSAPNQTPVVELAQDPIAAKLAQHAEKPFVQRILRPDSYDPLVLSGGDTASHMMAYSEVDGRHVVYPTVIQGESGELRKFPFDTALDMALKSGNFIDFDTAEEADFFSKNYKRYFGDMPAEQAQPVAEIEQFGRQEKARQDLRANATIKAAQIKAGLVNPDSSEEEFAQAPLPDQVEIGGAIIPTEYLLQSPDEQIFRDAQQAPPEAQKSLEMFLRLRDGYMQDISGNDIGVLGNSMSAGVYSGIPRVLSAPHSVAGAAAGGEQEALMALAERYRGAAKNAAAGENRQMMLAKADEYERRAQEYGQKAVERTEKSIEIEEEGALGLPGRKTGMYEPEVAGLSDIKSGEDLANFVLQGAAETAPMMAAAVGTTLVAGPAGGFLTSMALETSEINKDIYRETGEVRGQIAGAYGVAAGALEGLGAGTLAQKLIGKGVKEAAIKSALHKTTRAMIQSGAIAAGEQALIEGSTEFMQTYIEELATEMAKDPEWDVERAKEFIGENLEGSLGAALIGSFVGGAPAGVATAAHTPRVVEAKRGDLAMDEALRQYDDAGSARLEAQLAEATKDLPAIEDMDGPAVEGETVPQEAQSPNAEEVVAEDIVAPQESPQEAPEGPQIDSEPEADPEAIPPAILDPGPTEGSGDRRAADEPVDEDRRESDRRNYSRLTQEQWDGLPEIAKEEIRHLWNETNRDPRNDIYNANAMERQKLGEADFTNDLGVAAFRTGGDEFQIIINDEDGNLSHVVAIDVDNLKGVNDNFGHKAGNVAIRAAADIINEETDQYDPEYNTPEELAIKIQERIMNTVLAYEAPDGSSHDFVIGASVGTGKDFDVADRAQLDDKQGKAARTKAQETAFGKDLIPPPGRNDGNSQGLGNQDGEGASGGQVRAQEEGVEPEPVQEPAEEPVQEPVEEPVQEEEADDGVQEEGQEEEVEDDPAPYPDLESMPKEQRAAIDKAARSYKNAKSGRGKSQIRTRIGTALLGKDALLEDRQAAGDAYIEREINETSEEVLGLEFPRKMGEVPQKTEVATVTPKSWAPNRETKARNVRRMKRLNKKRFKNMKPKPPKAKRIELKNDKGDYLVLGKGKTWEDQKRFLESQLTKEEIQDAASWYDRVAAFFEEKYGKDGPEMMVLWGLSQIQQSPDQGFNMMMRLLEAIEREEDPFAIPGMDLPKDKMFSWLQKAGLKYSDKLADFIDSLLDNDTRLIMDHDPDAGPPAAIDVWSGRDAGFVDGPTVEMVENVFGVKIPRNQHDVKKSDQKFGGDEAAYDWAHTKVTGLWRDAVESGWAESMGIPDMKARDFQAIGWVAMRKLYGKTGDLLQERNVQSVSTEAAPGAWSDLDQTFGDRYEALPRDERAKATHEIVLAASEEAAKIAGLVSDPEFAEGPGGWTPDKAPAPIISESVASRVLAGVEAGRIYAASMGYMLRQTAVVLSRQASAKDSDSIPTVLLRKADGSEFTPQEMEDLYDQLRASDAASYAPGFSPHPVGMMISAAESKRGPEGLAEMEAAVSKVLESREDLEMGFVPVQGDGYISNDWRKNPNGEDYLAIIEELAGPRAVAGAKRGAERIRETWDSLLGPETFYHFSTQETLEEGLSTEKAGTGAAGEERARSKKAIHLYAKGHKPENRVVTQAKSLSKLEGNWKLADMEGPRVQELLEEFRKERGIHGTELVEAVLEELDKLGYDGIRRGGMVQVWRDIPAEQIVETEPLTQDNRAKIKREPLGTLAREENDGGQVDEDMEWSPGKDPDEFVPVPRPSDAESVTEAAREQRHRPGGVDVAPLKGGTRTSIRKIHQRLAKALKKKIKTDKKMPQLGTYRFIDSLTTIKRANDLLTVAHEIGHYLDQVGAITATIIAKRDAQAMKAIKELNRFWPTSGVDPAADGPLKFKEGFSEWLVAYVINPGEATGLAPTFTELLGLTKKAVGNEYVSDGSVIPEDTWNAINEYSNSIRLFAGLPDIDVMASNIRMPEPGVMGGINAIRDGQTRKQLIINWIDDLHPIVSAIESYLERPAFNNILPSKNPLYLLRLLSGNARRAINTFEYGIPLFGQVNADGTMKRASESLKGILGALDNSSLKAHEEERIQAIAFMIAQRTIEKAGQIDKKAAEKVKKILSDDLSMQEQAEAIQQIMIEIDRMKSNIGGWGAGVFKDLDVARGALESLESGDQAKLARIQEFARRYREAADGILRYLVDSGYRSEEWYQKIKEDNQFYVDMHRYLSDDYALEPGSGGWKGNLASERNLIKNFVGATDEIIDPVAGLMKQVEKVLYEADRNYFWQQFTDLLNEGPEMDEGPPTNSSELAFRWDHPRGRKRKKFERPPENHVKVWRDGEPEIWVLDPAIYEAGRAMGEILPQNIAHGATRFLKTMITSTLKFIVRNIQRDTSARAVLSRYGTGLSRKFGPLGLLTTIATRGPDGKLTWTYNKNILNALDAQGGGQGVYGVGDEVAYTKFQQAIARDLVKKGHIVASVGAIKEFLKEVRSASEAVNRAAGYSAAYNALKEDGLSDWDASIAAAYEARDLMDFAIMGKQTRPLNALLPIFLGPAIQGKERLYRAFKENPRRTTANILMYSVLPKAIFVAMAYSSIEDDDEWWSWYTTLPAHEKDFFYHFVVGGQKISIPIGFEISLPAAITGRAMEGFLTGDWDRATDGLYKSAWDSIMPIRGAADLVGPALLPLELTANFSGFHLSRIVPWYDEGKYVPKREGAKRASTLGKVAQAMSGDMIDPRYVDYAFKRLFSDWGRLTLGVSDLLAGKNPTKKRGITDAALETVGMSGTTGARSSTDVEWAYSKANYWGISSDDRFKEVRDEINASYGAKTPKEREAHEKKARQLAKKFRDDFRGLKPEQANYKWWIESQLKDNPSSTWGADFAKAKREGVMLPVKRGASGSWVTDQDEFEKAHKRAKKDLKEGEDG